MKRSKKIDFSNALVFPDRPSAYNYMAEKYKTHTKGYFILAPSGAGKTHFIKNQKQNDWIDGDDLWMAAGAFPKNEWWRKELKVIFKIEKKCDIITAEAKSRGFWIMGSSDFDLRPDAIVLPHWSTHKKYVKFREENDYDGGAKTDALARLLNHRKLINSWSKKGVPKFKSIDEAVNYLTSNIKG